MSYKTFYGLSCNPFDKQSLNVKDTFESADQKAMMNRLSYLKDLKMLMNFSYDSVNCFTLILSGEPYLNNTLEKSIHEALRQRITVHYAFQGLNPDEVVAYIRHKLHLAGGADTLIGEDALSALTSYCHGNPRIIDNVMSDALVLGAQLEKTTIDADVLLAAVNEQALT